ncbi:MAG: hypothetical protein GF417_09310, partial [Candidatus Latescibacteria bacterium]|nr:hypothetical protein [bacterium]MBD3424622.1 hypothetical protein [Candidatus Latescibacterota bacterium]
MQEICSEDRVRIKSCISGDLEDQYLKDIIEGLSAEKKRISSVFFYDEAGSKLFEKITALPEYYLYGTEMELLREISPQICSSFEGIDIVEIGSGDCSK